MSKFQLSIMDYDPELKKEYEYWECYTKMSDKALGNFMRGIIKFHGEITCTFTMEGGFPENKIGHMECHYKIKLPKGLKEQFEEYTKIKLEEPTKVGF